MTQKVLVVEDDQIIALDLAMALEERGFKPLGPAASGEQALALAERTAPDIALVDVNLTDGCTGLILGEKLAAKYATFVIIVTANPEGVEEGEGGIRRVVRKPFTHEAIAAELELAEREWETERPESMSSG